MFAASTGFRARECAAVRRGDFGPGLALVKVAGEFTKNGKEAVQPIPSFLRPLLAEAVRSLPDEDFLWPGGWKRDERGRWAPAGWVAGKDAGELLRRDATWVGIAVGRSGKEANGGRVLDFHSFRHSYVSALDRAGLSRELARASSRAILERYTHRKFGELAAAVEALPAIGVPGGGTCPAGEAHADGTLLDEPGGAGSSSPDTAGPSDVGVRGAGLAEDESIGAAGV